MEVSEHLNKVFSKSGLHIESRELAIEGEITPSMASKFRKSLLLLENINLEPVTVTINSEGGDVYSMFAIIDLIKTSPCTITTQALGLVASAALPIFCAGENRNVFSNTTFMHHASSVDLGPDKMEGHKVLSKHVKELEQRTNLFLASRTKKSCKFWATRGKHTDFYFNAGQALDMGVAQLIL